MGSWYSEAHGIWCDKVYFKTCKGYGDLLVGIDGFHSFHLGSNPLRHILAWGSSLRFPISLHAIKWFKHIHLTLLLMHKSIQEKMHVEFIIVLWLKICICNFLRFRISQGAPRTGERTQLQSLNFCRFFLNFEGSTSESLIVHVDLDLNRELQIIFEVLKQDLIS